MTKRKPGSKPKPKTLPRRLRDQMLTDLLERLRKQVVVAEHIRAAAVIHSDTSAGAAVSVLAVLRLALDSHEHELHQAHAFAALILDRMNPAAQ
jgi:hypothetical protein